MLPHRSAQTKFPANPGGDFPFHPDEFVVVAGEPSQFEVERDNDPLNIDHVWITIRAGRFGRLRISISTWSRKLAADGFDPRMRVAFIPSAWSELPAIWIQAWGAIYLRDRLGIHQVHSRRASHSVRTNYIGRDGALRFYNPDHTAEMVLFKYSGQA
jgi:hypothetical protein